MSETKHIVGAFDVELQDLTRRVLKMSVQCQELYREALEIAFHGKESPDFHKLDATINRMEQRIESRAARVLARRQPLATDLRVVIAATKIASDLERIADLGKNIARRSQDLPTPFPANLQEKAISVGEQALMMIQHATEAYEQRSEASALRVWRMDDALDEAYHDLFQATVQTMRAQPDAIEASAQLLLIAKHFERTGDHVTNICEKIYYIATGATYEQFLLNENRERQKAERAPSS